MYTFMTGTYLLSEVGDTLVDSLDRTHTIKETFPWRGVKQSDCEALLFLVRRLWTIVGCFVRHVLLPNHVCYNFAMWSLFVVASM